MRSAVVLQQLCVLGLQVYISYLEIYNEVGYDLLDPTREVQAMEDLPQASTGAQQHNSPSLPATAKGSRSHAWNSSSNSNSNLHAAVCAAGDHHGG
jgi:hypothetical protein